TVSLNVTFVNHAPVATAQTVSLAEDTLTTVTLTGTDRDNDPLSFKITSLPTHGALSVGTHTIVAADLPYSFTGANVDYVANTNFNGTDSFAFKANDGQFDSTSAATVSLIVTPVNDPPNANDY